MKPILIIKTGHTVKTAFARVGDFERWIISSMQASADECMVVEVYMGGNLPDSDTVSGVVITGSTAMVTDLADWSEASAQWLREAASNKLPILGICYGHQLLAHALGGVVDDHPAGREIGTVQIVPAKSSHSDLLFADIKEPFTAHVSHLQTVKQLPAGATLLASNAFEPHHAVRFSDYCWGLQFHPEFEEVAMSSYIEERQHDLRQEGLDVESLLTAVEATPVARKILADFYQLVKSNQL